MKSFKLLVLGFVACLAFPALANEDLSQRWRIRFDLGGNIPVNPTISELGGPVTTGGKMDLDAGMTFDMGVGFRVAPWFTLEAEIGFMYNEIDSIGNWSYPNSSLSQMPIMLNAEFSIPRGPLVPYAGIGAGGVLGSVSFGSYYYYYYSESDGWANNFVPAAQAFAGLRYEFDRNWSAGISYRFLAVPGYDWDVEWWNGADFSFGVDKTFTHSICVTFSGTF
jgi:opacity protein-like surface antigen